MLGMSGYATLDLDVDEIRFNVSWRPRVLQRNKENLAERDTVK